MAPPDDIIIRVAGEADLGLIMDTWQRCYGSPFWGDEAVRMGDFKRGHRRVIAKCLEDPALVAAYAEAPHVVVGWACGRYQRLHWVYVKKEFRGDGICHRLLRELGCGEGPLDTTHYSSAVERWRKTRPVRFDPYLLIG